METKSFLLSKTFWGTALLAVNNILKLFEIETPRGQDVEEVSQAIVDLVSAILIIWGLRTAEQPLTMSLKKKS